MNRNRLILSLIISPLATPLVTGVFLLLKTISVVYIYYSVLTALLISYALTPVGGLVVFFLLLKINRLTLINIIVVGTLLSFLSGIVISHLYDEPLFTAWWLYAGSGLLNSLLFSLIYFKGLKGNLTWTARKDAQPVNCNVKHNHSKL